MAFVAGITGPEGLGRWLAARSSVAVGAGVCVLAPALVLLSTGLSVRALQLAYTCAAVAGLLGLAQIRRLIRTAPARAEPSRTPWRPPAGLDRRFLGGVMLFWFGAALNRPVLPPYIDGDLHAPMSYFAVSAIVA